MKPDARSAILELLALADPPEMRPRGHRLTQDGSVRRFERYQTLPIIHTQLLRQDRQDDSAIVREACS